MIKLFRRTRQRLLTENKTGKYFKYAIGEIFLVVIGILIALQINNWNEGRKALIQEHAVLSNLVADLRADSASYVENMADLDKTIVLHDQLYDVISNKSNGDSLRNVPKIRALIWFNPITKENDPFIASKTSNEVIRREIQSYFRAMKNMEHIYDEFSTVIKSQMRPYLGTKGLYNLKTEFEHSKTGPEWLDKQGLIELSRGSEFQQLLFEAHIKLREVKEKLGVLMKQNEILKEKISLFLIDVN